MNRGIFLILLLSMIVTGGCAIITGTVETISPITYEKLEKKNMEVGNPIFIRVFKQENQLQLWVQDNKGEFKHFKNYQVCARSGELGPKLLEGDRQTPEGFYKITKKQLNPNSQYYRAFNIGYPNHYDRMLNRTGSNIMVHGGCSSAGCFAMTNTNIKEIYIMAKAAFLRGQKEVAIHIFPFKMTNEKTRDYKNHQWINFWINLKQGYDYFEKYNLIPSVKVNHQKERYAFRVIKG